MADDPSAQNGFLLVCSTFPDAGQAREIARIVVSEQLAACGNVLPGVTSIYVWQGEQQESAESLVLFKTRRELYPMLESRLKALHPYEVPEIIAVDVVAGLPAYLAWIAAGVLQIKPAACSSTPACGTASPC